MAAEFVKPKKDHRLLMSRVIVSRPDKSILFLNRTSNTENFPNFFNLPGGKKEADQSYLQAARDEVEQEAGIPSHKKALKYLGKAMDYLNKAGIGVGDRHRNKILTTNVYHLEVPQDQEVRLNGESDSFIWLTMEEAFALMICKEKGVGQLNFIPQTDSALVLLFLKRMGHKL